MNTTPDQTYVYDKGLRAFHWAMAALIVIGFAIGFYAANLPREDALRGPLFGMHKSIGVTILALAVLRLAWRLVKGAPAYRNPPPKVIKSASDAIHLALYALMFAMPISGFVMSQAGNHPIVWFGLFTLPQIAPIDKILAHNAGGAHVVAAWILFAIVALHAGAALWHHFVKHDEVLARMAPRLAGGSDQAA